MKYAVTAGGSVRRVALNISLMVVSALVASIAFDRLLILFGFPTERPGLYSHPPNLSQERVSADFRYTFRTNSHGLRYKDIPLKKPKGTLRTLIVGDSFVEGYGVELEHTFGFLLDQEFSNQAQPTNFLNGGLSGTGPLQYARLLYHVGLKYEPDALLICIYANDVSNIRENTGPEQIYDPRTKGQQLAHLLWPRLYAQLSLLKRQQRITEQPDFVEAVAAKARSKGIPEEQIEAWKTRIPRELLAAAGASQLSGVMLSYGLLKPTYWVESIDIEGPDAEQKWLAMTRILNETLMIARGRSMWVGTVYIPARFQYDPNDTTAAIWRLAGSEIRESWLSGESTLQRRLKAWAEDARVPFLDLTPAFRAAIKLHDSLNFELDDHWSAKGHRVAALSIAEWLSQAYDRLPPRQHRLGF